MISTIKAFLFALAHRRPLQFVVIRRYADAKGHFIGELYVDGKMAGMSCDSLPLGYGAMPDGVLLELHTRLDCASEFTDPMLPNAIRVGGNTPEETIAARYDMQIRRYCKVQWQICNRFIEHVMEKDIAR